MKKITISILAAFAVVGTAIAGPCPVSSKDFKQPCVTPCFRDTEWQLDIFYSFNDASPKGNNSSNSNSFIGDPFFTPQPALLDPILSTTAFLPTGSEVVPTARLRDNGRINQYFNDGSGGGVGLNYFFYRYIGIGVEGNWWDGCRGGGNFNGDFRLRNFVELPPGFATVPGLPGTAINLAALTAFAATENTSVTVLSGSTLVLTTRLDNNRHRHNNNHSREAANQITGSLILRYPFEGPICWAPYIFGGGGGIWDGESTGFGHIGLGVEFRVTPYMGFFTDWRWEFMGGHTNNNDWNNSNRASFVVFDPTTGLVTTRTLHVNNDNNNRKNDVNMTRVGIRFVF